MKAHYLESAIFALAHAVVREHTTTEQAIDVLKDMQTTGADDAQEPLFLNICHNYSTAETRYEYKTVGGALSAAVDNILEFAD